MRTVTSAGSCTRTRTRTRTRTCTCTRTGKPARNSS